MLQLRALLRSQKIKYLLMQCGFRLRVDRVSAGMRLPILRYQLLDLRALLIGEIQSLPHTVRHAAPLLDVTLNLLLLHRRKHREHLLVQRAKCLRVERASRRMRLTELQDQCSQLTLLLIRQIDIAQKVRESMMPQCYGEGLACRLTRCDALHLRLLGRRGNHAVMAARCEQ